MRSRRPSGGYPRGCRCRGCRARTSGHDTRGGRRSQEVSVSVTRPTLSEGQNKGRFYRPRRHRDGRKYGEGSCETRTWSPEGNEGNLIGLWVLDSQGRHTKSFPGNGGWRVEGGACVTGRGLLSHLSFYTGILGKFRFW